MKIERIELRHIKMPLVSPFTTSMGTDTAIEHIAEGYRRVKIKIAPGRYLVENLRQKRAHWRPFLEDWCIKNSVPLYSTTL